MTDSAMQYLLLGLSVLLIFMVASRGFVAANPAVLSRNIRYGAGVIALGTASILFVRGMAVVALWVAAFGLWLLTGSTRLVWPAWARPSTDQTGHQTSVVTTDHLVMELDLSTGSIRGQVVKGFFKGRDIETLRPVELAHLWSDCQFDDPQSAQILEAYLDRIHPTWRDDMARGGGNGSADDKAAKANTSQSMTREQALDILGLKTGATEEEIRRAHRLLMMKLHPDRGGSHTLAAKVNEAKDILLDD
jgi:hypothetical protein